MKVWDRDPALKTTFTKCYDVMEDFSALQQARKMKHTQIGDSKNKVTYETASLNIFLTFSWIS